MDTKNHDESVSALATQRDKSDIIMDDPNNTEPQGSTVSIHNTSSSSCSCSTVLYASNDRMRVMATNPASTTTNVEEKDSTEFRLPPEITIAVFGYLSIQNLLVCQRVSRHFRVFARTIMLDKLGGQAMGCQRQHCPQCRRNQQQPLWQRPSGGSSTSRGGGGGAGQHGSSGLPPLPYHHLINNPNTLLPTTVSPVSHHNLHLQPQDHPQHQLHHHLYQHQSTEDMSQHHQTDLHIHHQAHSYHVQPSRPVSTSQQSDTSAHNHQSHAPPSTSQYHPTASYVAPGNIALFLFPYHDHTPTSWQDRQSVHFVCTGIDRLKEQLVFSPIYPEVGDCLKFNTNSWNLPSTFAASGSFGDATSLSTPSELPGGGQDARTLNNTININDPRSTSRFVTTGGTTTTGSETTYSTGLDLFDYTTGRPRFPGSRQANADSLNSTSYSFANQFNRPHSRSPSLASISSSSSSSSSFSSTPPSPSRQPPSSSITTAAPPTPYWTNVTSHGGEHYSVIGIKHGDWPEDRQTAGRWWGGGLYSSMTQESMVHMPWVGASSAFDFHQGSSSSSHPSNGRTLTNNNNNNNNLTQDENMEDVSPSSYNKSRGADGGYTKIHKHHMYLSSTRPHNPPGHHHRFLCLHHDQLMTDVAAASSSSSPSSDSKSKKAARTPLTTAGSTHLEVDYGARVTESKRCLFCLSAPCKANLEIQVKFDQLRVSLDWILSGFGPDQKTVASSMPRSNGGSAIADALAMGSVRQGQVPS
ncbi:hypothetical protein F5H01DRAFT_411490 [Linnemannia elongata]|nr:hypothetical protein F5H01DRAFT_411490 [Linnemannia elongata]